MCSPPYYGWFRFRERHPVTGSRDGREEAVAPGPGDDDRVHEAGHQEGEDTWRFPGGDYW